MPLYIMNEYTESGPYSRVHLWFKLGQLLPSTNLSISFSHILGFAEVKVLATGVPQVLGKLNEWSSMPLS